MSTDRKEIEYYPEVCVKFTRYLQDTLGEDYKITYSLNKSLVEMVNEIHRNLELDSPTDYFSSLKTDIAFGVLSPSNQLSLLLLEVKRGKSLSLMNFSQLVGYLQVAKHIRLGILLLVQEGAGASPLSTDFSSIIDVGQLPAEWRVEITKSQESYNFQAGICMYTPGNGIDWVNTTTCNGLSSWDDLKLALFS